ncbi:MAG: nitrate reductase molybdenum cofactor assembly chaperone [Sphingomonadales bacterium]|nr:nitrate reductase molybdenum cofactor assembly chaperone [Sphingomonadales bacterium]
MRLTLRTLSALLRYPDEAVQQAAPELTGVLAEDGLLSPEQRASLQPLLDTLASADLLDSQERYVGLFDRGRAVSLHLFEHVHGESRDRGQAMVDLRDRYEAQGLEIAAKELPDYLPLFLEYLSVLPSAQAAEELAQPGVILSALADRLEEKGTPYAAPMRILADLAGAGGEAFEIAPADDPDDLAALDAAWEEEQIRFDAPVAPGTADCPQVAGMVDRMLAQEPVRSRIHG